MSVEQRRAALVEAAYRVIADHGVEGATTRRICAKAGMPLASFHYAFESRTALLHAVMETAVPTDITKMLDTIVAGTADPIAAPGPDTMRDSMYRHMQLFYILLKADPGRMQATISLGIYAHKHPALQEVGKQMYERLYDVAALGLETSARQLGVAWDQPARELAPVIIAATNAITLTYLSTADDAVVDQIIDSICVSMCAHVVDVPHVVRH